MKKFILVLFLLLIGSSVFAQNLLIIKENNDFDEALKGFYDSFPGKAATLSSKGFTRANVVVKIKRAMPRLILAVGPEALAKADQATIPIVYLGVDNTAPYHGRENITGISTGIPATEQLKVFLKAIPSIERLGVVYSAGSSLLVDEARHFSGVELIEIEAPFLRDSVPAIRDVFEKGIDAFWVISDVGVYYPEMHHYLYMLSFQNRIPLLTTVPQFREEAAVVSLEIDLTEMGRQTGEMVTRILGGQWVEPAIAAYEIRVNEIVAGKMGITFDKEWLAEL